LAADSQVLVLGGGISGCLIGCLLADQGLRVSIVEQHDDLMAGASRWTEGKLHLGYVYTATDSLSTARLMQRGTAMFLGSIERITGEAIPESWFSRPVIYVVDRRSLVPPDLLWQRAEAVARALGDEAARSEGLARHLGTGELLKRLDADEARAATGERNVAAAWQTTERSISPRCLAEALRAAVTSRTIPVLRNRVTRVSPAPAGWNVILHDGEVIAGDVVINCLWENRRAIDLTVTQCDEPVSIRYRRALFGRGLTRLAALTPSTRILGRFGDVTPFANGDACLTWYPAGLIALSDDGTAPVVPSADELEAGKAAVLKGHVDGLGLDPWYLESPDKWEVRGGYVVAYGFGDIDRLDTPLHTRDRADARELQPGYISVDTGKLCLGPLMASRAAALATERLRVTAR
jgi:hypothetical protein